MHDLLVAQQGPAIPGTPWQHYSMDEAVEWLMQVNLCPCI